MGRKINTAKQAAKLEKALKAGLKKAAEEKIAPMVKEELKKKTKSKMKTDFKPNQDIGKAENNKARRQLSGQKDKLTKTLTSDFWIENTPLMQSGDRSYIIIRNTAKPNDPLWNRNNSEDTTLTDWIVNGKMVIHPALTNYRGKYVDDAIIDPDVSDWDDYVQKYRFKPVDFIKITKKEIRSKKYKERMAKDIRNAMQEEINKVFKKTK